MNLKEAYSILELEPGASPDDVKKKYRELTKKYHPDVNKEPGAEDKFKKINEAHQCVKDGKGNDRETANPFRHGRNPFSGHQQVIELENIETHLTIDFKESVLGCRKEIKYNRKTKCSKCDGHGQSHLDNGCQKCKGKGQVTVQRQGMVYISTCPDCRGKIKLEECTLCQGQGTLHAEASIHVAVPPGIVDGNILRLQGMGNFAGSFMGFADQHTDAFCHIKVIPEPELSIEGRDVVFTLTVPLLEALRGCNKTVKTIHGSKEIHVKPGSRNREEVTIPHCGVGGTGNQRVILNVEYPKNTNKLIDVLIDEVV